MQPMTFVCPSCKRRGATEKTHLTCPYCGEVMVPLAAWLRHEKRARKPKGDK